jgi:hypothetical protein
MFSKLLDTIGELVGVLKIYKIRKFNQMFQVLYILATALITSTYGGIGGGLELRKYDAHPPYVVFLEDMPGKRFKVHLTN